MRALVTGCAGFIGSHLTESLLADGHAVVGVDCFNDNYDPGDKRENLRRAHDWDGFELVPLDLAREDPGLLVDGCDVVFHLAAEPGVHGSWGPRFERYLHNNVAATQRLLEAAARSGPRVVYASSSSVYGDVAELPTGEHVLPQPCSPYGTTKLAGEHLLHAYGVNHGLETVVLRYFTVYGPRQRPDMAFTRFCRAALAGEPITLFGDGRRSRDFTYVTDVVAATRAAATEPVAAGGVYNVAGGSCASLAEVLTLLEGLTGGPLAARRAPAPPGEVAATAADTSAARRDFGFAPDTRLEDGLAAQLDWVVEALPAGTRA